MRAFHRFASRDEYGRQAGRHAERRPVLASVEITCAANLSAVRVEDWRLLSGSRHSVACAIATSILTWATFW